MIIDLPPDVIAPEVQAAASPTEVRLGDPFTLYVTVAYDEHETVNLVRPLELSDAFEALPGKEVSTDSVLSDGRKKREWQIRVVAWELGDLMIPPLPVTFTFSGQAAQVATKPVPVRVVGTLGDIVDDKQMRPLARPAVILSRDYFLLIVIAAVLGAVVAVIIGLKLRVRRRRRVLGSAWTSEYRLPRRLEPAAEEALRRLAELEQSGRLDDDAERTGAYRELSDIIRTYLGRRAGFVHHDRTTAEIMERLRGKPISALADLLDDIEAWLEGCDLVKFAAYEATAVEAHSALDGARELVLQSIAEKPAPPAEGKGPGDQGPDDSSAADTLLDAPAAADPAPAAEPPPPEEAARG